MVEFRLINEEPYPKTRLKIKPTSWLKEVFESNIEFIKEKESNRFIYYILPYDIKDSEDYIKEVIKIFQEKITQN